MTDETRYVGTELGTVELLGAIDRDAPLVAPVVAAGVVTVAPRPELSIVVLAMRGLRPRRLGWPRFDYAEVLWRIGAHRGDRAVWVVTRCDLDSRIVATMARRQMRYDVHRAGIVIADDDAAAETRRIAVDADAGILSATLTATAPVEPPASRPQLVDGGRYHLPWREEPQGVTRAASIDLTSRGLLDALAPTASLDRAVLYTRRAHACGIARA